MVVRRRLASLFFNLLRSSPDYIGSMRPLRSGIPIVMERPTITTQTLRPSPLVLTSRAPAMSRERVPYGAASSQETLRSVDAAAAPRARMSRPPVAKGTPDPTTVLVLAQLERGHPVHPTGRVPLEEPHRGIRGLVDECVHIHRLLHHWFELLDSLRLFHFTSVDVAL
jgi:hypothetical protein